MKRNLVFSTREIKDKGGLVFAEKGPLESFFEGEDASRWAREDEARPEGETDIRLEFSVGGEEVLVSGTVQGSWRLRCSRCLGEYPASLSAEMEETYPLHQETISVGEDVRQAMILSLPVKPLCRESCKGLCPRCGADLNRGPCSCPKKGSQLH